MEIRAITLDLDDTLWPVMPVIRAAERAVFAWLEAYCPRVTQRYDSAGLSELRDRVAEENPDRAHDLSAMRRLTFARALTVCGYPEDKAEAAFEVFIEARHQVRFYDDVMPALEQLSSRYPLAAISNGSADVRRLGLEKYFRFSVHAKDVGRPKPAADIFDAAAGRLGFRSEHILHVGDHLEQDVMGARSAGFQALWLDRARSPGVDGIDAIHSLTELADRLAPEPIA